MQSRKPILPPSRAVLVLLPLTLIEALDYASNVLKMHRTDVIRRSLMRDVNSLLREEVSRAQRHQAATGLVRSVRTIGGRQASQRPVWSALRRCRP